jgi:hypothetical protein
MGTLIVYACIGSLSENPTLPLSPAILKKMRTLKKNQNLSLLQFRAIQHRCPCIKMIFKP